MDFEEALDKTYYDFKSSRDLYKQWLSSVTNER